MKIEFFFCERFFPAAVKAVCAVLDTADRAVYYYHCLTNNGVNLSL